MNARKRATANTEVTALQAQVKIEQDQYKTRRTDPRFPRGRFARPDELPPARSSTVTGVLNGDEYKTVHLGYFTHYSYDDNGVVYERQTSEGALDLSYDWRERDDV